MMNLQEATEILNSLKYPTGSTIKAYAIKYPSLFRHILKDEQIQKIIIKYPSLFRHILKDEQIQKIIKMEE